MIERKLKRLVGWYSWRFLRLVFAGNFLEVCLVKIKKVKHLSNVIEKNSELFLPFFRIPFFQNSNFLFQYLRFSKLYFLFQYLRIGDCSNLKWALARSGGRFLLTFCYTVNLTLSGRGLRKSAFLKEQKTNLERKVFKYFVNKVYRIWRLSVSLEIEIEVRSWRRQSDQLC